MKRKNPDENIKSIFFSLDEIFKSEKDEREIEKEVLYFFDYHMMKGISFSEISDFKKMMDRTKEISNRYNKILLILKRTTDNYIKTIENTIKETKYKSDFQDKYPKFVSPEHPKEAIKFYDKIDKLYSGTGFSIVNASELINVTRQTLSKWIKEEKFGLKRRKTNKILLEELYNCYLNILLKKINK